MPTRVGFETVKSSSGPRARARASATARPLGRRPSGTRVENTHLAYRDLVPGWFRHVVTIEVADVFIPVPRRRAPAAAGGSRAGDRRGLHAVAPAQGAARDPARGSHGAAGDGERLVSRRLGPREAGPHRLRAPV